MTFGERIKGIYEACGPDHLLPFIGASYEDGDSTAFRAAVIGLNAYVTDGDWPKDRTHLRGWYPAWWRDAGRGKKQRRYFNVAFREADRLAAQLTASELFGGLEHDRDPASKTGLYGTNAVKVFLGQKYKKSSGLEALLPDYALSWHHELEAMAEYGVLPHLLIVLGSQIWGTIWRSLHPSHGLVSDHFKIAAYKTCGGKDDPCYHHANRIVLSVKERPHTIILVRLTHPAAQDDRRGKWLLAQPNFRILAGLPSAG
jgi:hypothetical protein